MLHRHLDYDSDAPVSELGDAALDALLERGDLQDWQPLAKAVSREPHGELAERVLRLCDANSRYGTSRLWRRYIFRCRARVECPPTMPVTLSELRGQRQLTQAELAAEIGMRQSDLSKAERRSDWRLSTLRRIVAGTGHRLRLVLEDADGRCVAELVPVEGGETGSTPHE